MYENQHIYAREFEAELLVLYEHTAEDNTMPIFFRGKC
jgi:hypothetical protein